MLLLRIYILVVRRARFLALSSATTWVEAIRFIHVDLPGCLALLYRRREHCIALVLSISLNLIILASPLTLVLGTIVRLLHLAGADLATLIVIVSTCLIERIFQNFARVYRHVMG